MLAATDDRGVEIAQGCLKPDRGRIQSLVLGKPWTVRRETHKEVGQGFIVRCKVDGNLVRVSGSHLVVDSLYSVPVS
jgi:hypothetical protein